MVDDNMIIRIKKYETRLEFYTVKQLTAAERLLVLVPEVILHEPKSLVTRPNLEHIIYGPQKNDPMLLSVFDDLLENVQLGN